uniref:Subfamily of SANT domain n=1 Tax=Rhipicephalus appendiculatus TaxID=34631 RepID=A0A131YQZ0_RHIAP
MRKKRRPCSSLAPGEDGRMTPELPDRSMQQCSGSATVSGVAEQRLATVKPAHSDESLAELFALIESNPCLWKNDSKSFKNLRLKRRLWNRFAVHLQKHFPMLGPFTGDNLRYVYSIKRRQYYDELKDKTGRTKTGELEYTGRWKFFDCLSFLRVHSEPFRTAVISPLLHFEREQLVELDEEGDDAPLDDGDGSVLEPDEQSILPDSVSAPPEPQAVTNDEPGTGDGVEFIIDTPSAPPPTKKIRSSTTCLDVKPFLPVAPSSSTSDNNAVPQVESLQSQSPAVGGYYDECDQFGNIIANYMRRLSDEGRLEFHCHIMSCTKDFFKCFTRFNDKRRP